MNKSYIGEYELGKYGAEPSDLRATKGQYDVTYELLSEEEPAEILFARVDACKAVYVNVSKQSCTAWLGFEEPVATSHYPEEWDGGIDEFRIPCGETFGVSSGEAQKFLLVPIGETKYLADSLPEVKALSANTETLDRIIELATRLKQECQGEDP